MTSRTSRIAAGVFINGYGYEPLLVLKTTLCHCVCVCVWRHEFSQQTTQVTGSRVLTATNRTHGVPSFHSKVNRPACITCIHKSSQNRTIYIYIYLHGKGHRMHAAFTNLHGIGLKVKSASRWHRVGELGINLPTVRYLDGTHLQVFTARRTVCIYSVHKSSLGPQKLCVHCFAIGNLVFYAQSTITVISGRVCNRTESKSYVWYWLGVSELGFSSY